MHVQKWLNAGESLSLNVLILAVTLLYGCNNAPRTAPVQTPARPAVTGSAGAVVATGADVLADEDFERLSGRRLGFIVNHTAMADTAHIVDLAHRSPNVEVTALFGPEHGIRGTAVAGEEVEHGRDARTGVPVYSLYGETRKPTEEMLRDVDVLVFDIQDIGTRFYTYISTMGLAMQAAAEAGIPFVVLDRPNPLGGELVEGFMLEPQHRSFVGQFEIPIVHGLTVGELARMIKGEGLMEGLEDLDLQVVGVEGWDRSMRWSETGLPWLTPSPNIPDFLTALVYPGTGFFEATSASEGRGTRMPFLQVGAPWADAAAMADTLNSRRIPGVRFEPAEFTPVSIEGMATRPKLENRSVKGVRLEVTDVDAFHPVATGVHVLHAFYHDAARRNVNDFLSRPEWLTRLSGTERFGESLRRNAGPEQIASTWAEEVEAFKERRRPYLLYD